MQHYSASVTGVFKMILMILALFFIVRILGRLFMPFLKSNQGRGQSQASRSETNSRKEGEVRIEYTDKNRQNQSRKDSGEGDYIDFEELDKP
jgi:hypothetical protein